MDELVFKLMDAYDANPEIVVTVFLVLCLVVLWAEWIRK